MAAEPWYRRPLDPHPFRISAIISSKTPDPPDYRSLACFPWTKNSLANLWAGNFDYNALEIWNAMVLKYQGAVAVGTDRNLAYIFFTQGKRSPICIKLPEEPSEKLIDQDSIHVAWVVAEQAINHPLVVLSRGSLIYIYSPEAKGISGYLRGHGGAITSIAAHPTKPHMFCTTSRDMSTRIYDISASPVQSPKNPRWPPSPYPSLAGAAHGLHTNEIEGTGIGRCIVVLLGGRSGGHHSTVLGAAFHPTYPLIATCGLDRCVKIWAVRVTNKDVIAREDKPIFSSSRIHKSRVLSVTWLQGDILLTHSAPALMRIDPFDTSNKETRVEPGEVVIWRWLGLNRFFPPLNQDQRNNVLRGCVSDYQESSSFKTISVYSFKPVLDQYIAHHMQVFHSPSHDPIAVTTLPASDNFILTNLAEFKPRKILTFSEVLPQLIQMDGLNAPEDAATTDLTSAAQGLHIDESPDENVVCSRGGKQFKPIYQPPVLEGWEVKLPQGTCNTVRLNCAAVTCEGRIIVGVGTDSTLWVWKRGDKGAGTGSP